MWTLSWLDHILNMKCSKRLDTSRSELVVLNGIEINFPTVRGGVSLRRFTLFVYRGWRCEQIK